MIKDLTADELELIKSLRKAKNAAFDAECKKNIDEFHKLYPSTEYAFNAVPSVVKEAFLKHGIPIISAEFDDIDMRFYEDWAISFLLKDNGLIDEDDNIGEYQFDHIFFYLEEGNRHVENIGDWVTCLNESIDAYVADIGQPSDCCKNYGSLSLSQATIQYEKAIFAYNSTIDTLQEIIEQLEESLAQGGEEC